MDYLNLAQVKLSEGDTVATLVELDSAIFYNHKNTKAFYLRARIKENLGDLRGAVQDYEEVVSIEPENAEVNYHLAYLYFRLRDHRNYAINAIDEAILYARDNSKYYVMRAFLRAHTNNPYTGKPEFQKAINDMFKAITIDPGKHEYYSTRAEYRFEIDQREEAVADLDRAISLDPQNAGYYGNRGLMKLLMEEYDEAIRDLTKAISLDPNEEEYVRNRGHSNYNSGRYRNAIDDYSEAIRILVSKLRIENNDQQIAEINEKLQDIYLIRGSAFIQLDLAGQACDDFRRALDLGDRRGLNYMRRFCY